MLQTEEAKQRLRHMRAQLIQSVAINLLGPFVLYMLLRSVFTSDATALALAGAVPTVRTMALWVMRRRVDWIGLYAILGFAIGVAVLVLSSGNELLLKIHDQLLIGTVGFVLLVSALFNKPLLVPLVQLFSQSQLEQARSPSISIATGSFGLILLGNAIAHVVMALTLPTETFLVMSRMVTFVLLGSALALSWWVRRRAAGLKPDNGSQS